MGVTLEQSLITCHLVMNGRISYISLPGFRTDYVMDIHFHWLMVQFSEIKTSIHLAQLEKLFTYIEISTLIPPMKSRTSFSVI